jgi:hypothetical protein
MQFFRLTGASDRIFGTHGHDKFGGPPGGDDSVYGGFGSDTFESPSGTFMNAPNTL